MLSGRYQGPAKIGVNPFVAIFICYEMLKTAENYLQFRVRTEIYHTNIKFLAQVSILIVK